MISRMTAATINLRPGEQRDAAAIAEIYAPIVRDTAISFELESPMQAVIAERIETIQQRHPWLVTKAEDEVVGCAYAGEHRPRAAYRWSVDVTADVA